MSSPSAITFVMPAYRAATTLPTAVASLQSQTSPRWRLVIVDDQSPDDTARVADDLAALDERIEVLHLPVNGGAGAARNAGMERVHSEYLGFLDADDTVDADLVEKVLTALDDEPADVVVFGLVEEFHGPTGAIAGGRTIIPAASRQRTPDEVHRSVLELEESTLFGYQWNHVYATRLIRDNGITFEKSLLYEDYFFNLDAIRHAASQVALDIAPYHYVKGQAGSITGTAHIPEYFELASRRIQTMLDAQRGWGLDDADTRERLATMYMRYLLSAVARNADPRSGMARGAQADWLRGTAESPLFQELAQPATPSSRPLREFLNLVRRGQFGAAVVLGSGVRFVKDVARPLYERLTRLPLRSANDPLRSPSDPLRSPSDPLRSPSDPLRSPSLSRGRRHASTSSANRGEGSPTASSATSMAGLPSEGAAAGPERVLVYGMTDNPGGIESYLLNRHAALAGDELVLDFVCDFPTMVAEDRLQAAGSRVFHIPAKGRNAMGHVAAFRRLLAEHPEYRTVYLNLVDAGQAITAAVAKAMGRRVVAHSHNSQAPRAGMHRAFVGLLNRVVDDRYACSSAASDFMFGPDADAPVIPNAIDLTRFQPDSGLRERTRRELGLDGLVVLTVGRMQWQKNPERLVEIMAALLHQDPHATLLWAGDGELRPEVERLVDELGIGERVRLLGRRDDVPALMQAADVFLLPSRYEGLAFVLVEAQSSGLPGVVSATVAPESDAGGLTFVPLESSNDAWASAILDAAGRGRVAVGDVLAERGYDVHHPDQATRQLLSSLVRGGTR